MHTPTTQPLISRWTDEASNYLSLNACVISTTPKHSMTAKNIILGIVLGLRKIKKVLRCYLKQISVISMISYLHARRLRGIGGNDWGWKLQVQNMAHIVRGAGCTQMGAKMTRKAELTPSTTSPPALPCTPPPSTPSIRKFWRKINLNSLYGCLSRCVYMLLVGLSVCICADGRTYVQKALNRTLFVPRERS